MILCSYKPVGKKVYRLAHIITETQHPSDRGVLKVEWNSKVVLSGSSEDTLVDTLQQKEVAYSVVKKLEE